MELSVMYGGCEMHTYIEIKKHNNLSWYVLTSCVYHDITSDINTMRSDPYTKLDHNFSADLE